MKLGKMMVAVVGATVLLASVVGMASARNLSTSSQGLRASFARLDFVGGFGTAECEVVVEGSFHSRTIVKSVGTLSGFITAANITRCIRGGATVLRETLPWHIRYAGFAGTLPNITSITATISGIAFRIREPAFGVTCLATTSGASIVFHREASGATTSVTAGATNSCSGVNGTLNGNTTAVDNGSGARITVTLI
ncbi:MAG: hypothetical protein ACJ76L_06580 [Conexibacter sp.]